jgi:hypothetical protein
MTGQISALGSEVRNGNFVLFRLSSIGVVLTAAAFLSPYGTLTKRDEGIKGPVG